MINILLINLMIIIQNYLSNYTYKFIILLKTNLKSISYQKKQTKKHNEKKRKTYIINLKINNNLFSVSQKNKKSNHKEKEIILKSYIEKNNKILIGEEEFLQIYIIIKQKLIKNKIPVNSPIAITLGGQPGAGKSNLYKIARKRFSNNIVEIDLDKFRIFHPFYWQIKKIYGKNDSIKTNPFVFMIVDMLIEDLSSQKYNLIIESSLNTPSSALYNGKYLPSKGYKVELHIMATSKEISRQSTIARYNKGVRNGRGSRFVSEGFHNTVVSNICNSLEIVKNSGLMSNILLYNRNQKCLYNMQKDIETNPCKLLNSIIHG